MTSKSFLSLSLVLLVTLALATSQKGVSEARHLPRHARRNSGRVLPLPAARNWHDKAAASLKTCLDHAKKLNGMIGIVQNDPNLKKLAAISRDSIITTCKETFETNIDNMVDALAALAKNDKNKISVDLSASGLVICSDAYAEFGVPFPPFLAQEDRVFVKEIDTGLTAAQS